MSFSGFGAKKEKVSMIFFKKFGKTVVIGNIQQMPVIKSGPLELAVVNGKAHGTHQMKPGAGSGAGSGDIAGILRNFRFDEYNIEGWQKIDSFKSPKGGGC